MVRVGLAEFVWVKTPGAEIRVAKASSEGEHATSAAYGRRGHAMGRIARQEHLGVSPLRGLSSWSLPWETLCATSVVCLRLADFAWMETPDGEIRTAQALVEGNERLAAHGSQRHALGRIVHQ